MTYYVALGLFLLFAYCLYKIKKLERKNKELENANIEISNFVKGVATNIHTIVTEQTKAIDLISKYEQENKEEFELFRGDVAQFILALNEQMTGFGKKDARISPLPAPKKNDKNNKPN
jgi:hypothetical protein